MPGDPKYIRRLIISRFSFVLACLFLASGLARGLEEKNGVICHSIITGSGEKARGPDAEITVEIDKPYIAPDARNNGVISPDLYGSNWASWFEFSPDVIEKARPLNLKVIRLGGSPLSRYNWRSNKLTFPGSNEAHLQSTSIDNFVQSCRELGAEPLIQINAMGWAPNDKNNDRFEKCLTVRDAVDLVTYLNRTKGYKVRYFEIDNEPEIWHEIHSDVIKEECTIEKYTEIFKDFSYAIKKAQSQIDPANEIKIFGPAISKSWQFSDVTYFLAECKKFEEDKAKNPEGYRILDVLSFHYYPMFRTDWKDRKSFIPEGVPAMLESAQTWWNPSYVNIYDYNQDRDEVACTIPTFNRYIKKYYPGTALAVTETSVDSAEFMVYDTVVEPIYMADLCGIMAKYGVDYAMPQWVVCKDPGFGMIMNHSGKIQPAYYTIMLYSQHFKGTILTASSNKSDLLNVYACDDKEGNIVLMIVNKNAKDYNVAVNLAGYKGIAVEGRFYCNSGKYSLTCVKIPKDNKKTQADLWAYNVKD